MSLATKYRPQRFEDVCGNKTTVTILKKVIEARKFKNVMLFAGASGCGKTTLARLVAKEINGNSNGITELDCASHNSVDDIRVIIDLAKERSLDSEYKIFILDECHMLSSAAWNASLKLLEECPKYTLLFFCTTDPIKIPLTVLNRMQRYNISKIDNKEIIARLKYVCSQEGYTHYDKACDFISKISGGSMREALTNLEKCVDYSSDLSLENVKTVLGDLSYETMFRLTWSLTQKKEDQLFSIIESLDKSGQDLKAFITTYTEFILDLNKYIIFKDISLTNIPEYLASEENPVAQFTINIEDNLNYFNKLVETLLEIKLNTKYDTSCKNTIIIYLLKFMRAN